MSTDWMAALLFCTALLVSLGVFPFVLRFAKRHRLMDAPNERKLQRAPVPVMGGMVVFLGILIAMCLAIEVFRFRFLRIGLSAMAVMWAIGTWDDLRDLPAEFRFAVELVLIWVLGVFGDIGINDFYGLWGLQDVPMYYAMPVSVIAGVGIINAINLMDGVDGYCSGFGIMASILFSVFFFSAGDSMMGCFCLICAGALIPFLLHNVFGERSKMYIGDGGSLMLGAALSVNVLTMLSGRPEYAAMAERGMGLIAFSLAVLAVPVFDTLRVMCIRIYRGKSPFHSDRTHLHHLFIEMGFSHLGAALSIIGINLLVVAVWYVSWRAGVSVDWQLYIVAALGVLVTFVFYRFMKVQRARNGGTGSPLYRRVCRLGAHTRIERRSQWIWMRHFVDDVINLKDE